MIAAAPEPLTAAVARIRSKTAIGTSLSTAQIARIDLATRERAFFTARIEDARTVAMLQSLIDDAIAQGKATGAWMSRDKFIAEARARLGAAPGDSGQLTDITSARRLGLIYDFNVQDAIEYGRWLARQDPAILKLYPCDELVRVAARRVPRGWKRQGVHGPLVAVPEEGWPARWEAAGGQFYGAQKRMIALKDDPIWIAISRFGRPWPPFDFESGMGRRDVIRSECLRLGAILPDTPPPAPQPLDFNHNLQASIPEAGPELLAHLQKAFGPLAKVAADGTIAWKGGTLAQLAGAGIDVSDLGGSAAAAEEVTP